MSLSSLTDKKKDVYFYYSLSNYFSDKLKFRSCDHCCKLKTQSDYD